VNEDEETRGAMQVVDSKGKQKEADDAAVAPGWTEGTGGWIVWTGSWDREVGILSVDELLARSGQAKEQDRELKQSRRHGLYAPAAFMPAASLPTSYTFGN
jgi:hypothetical protein